MDEQIQRLQDLRSRCIEWRNKAQRSVLRVDDELASLLKEKEELNSEHPISEFQFAATAPWLPSSTSSPFMELPGELRNRIYRFTFETEEVQIDSNVFPEPALLSVSTQVRKEAGPIYYAERKFYYYVRKYDSTPAFTYLLKERAFIKEFKLDRYQVKGFIREENQMPNWKNLVKWLRRIHRYGEPFGGDPHNEEEATVEAMFAVAYEMRKVPWDQVKTLLSSHWMILAHIDDGWNKGFMDEAREQKRLEQTMAAF